MMTFQDALAQTEGKRRHLLLGNGFSAKYFSGHNLLEAAGFAPSEAVRKLLEQQGSPDFERVIRRLEEAAKVARAYGEIFLEVDFEDDAERVRAALVKAVQKLHPHRHHLPETCDKFLSHFDFVFTLNYDLLLYYTAIDGKVRLFDGFVGSASRGGFRGPFRKDVPCNTFNIHGGLHLFQTPSGEVEKRLRDGSGTVIDAIATTITQDRRLPIYIAEGTTEQKMAKINAVPYLRHCYDRLGAVDGALFIFGHSARDEDQHIYDAIFRSGAEHIFFGLYEPADFTLMRGQLAKFQARNNSGVPFSLYDAKTAKAWVSVFEPVWDAA